MPLPAAPEAPVIDTQRTYAYDQIFLCWRLPQHSPPAWHYTVECRKTDTKAKGLKLWQRREEVHGTSALVEYLDTDSVYVLRVKGCNKAGFGEYSEDIYLHTPPAPGEGCRELGAAIQHPTGRSHRPSHPSSSPLSCSPQLLPGQPLGLQPGPAGHQQGPAGCAQRPRHPHALRR